MKYEKLHAEIKELHNEIIYMKGLMNTMSHQLQDLHEHMENRPGTEYIHPWYKFKQDLIKSATGL